VEAWLRTQAGFERARVEAVEPFAGGASNITCRLALRDAPVAAAVLRLQRTRGIFEPYDVLREGEVLRRLAATDVPVPRVLAAEHDLSVLGAPFLLLEFVDAPHMGEAGPEADFGAFTAAVAGVHALDWRAAGLDMLGVPASPAAGFAAEVETVAKRMPAFGCEREPLLARALDALRACTPGGGRLALCQGDINVFNYLFRARKVVAVVDWEQARISDPRSDVGHLLALSHLKGAPFGPAEEMPFAVMYGQASGRPLEAMAPFRAFWLFQLGVIYHGWRAFNGSDPWYTWPQLEELLGAALAEL